MGGQVDGSLVRGYERLLAVVSENPGWVAFSGGVDSTLVLKAACDAKSFPVAALFADSPLQGMIDRDNVRKLVELLGCELVVLPFDPLSWPHFTANLPDRCYLCKKAVFGQFRLLLPPGLELLDGTNHDDLGEDRPGQLAVAELGVISPLALSGIAKAEIRQLAKWLGLPNWNRPSASCLATRIPEGVVITLKNLHFVEELESIVRRHIKGHIRVRVAVDPLAELVVELCSEEMTKADFSVSRENILGDLRRVVSGEVMFRGRKGVAVLN